MQSYRQSSDQAGIEPWLDFEEEGVEVLEGDPKQSGRIDWGSAEGPMSVGVWECTPGKLRMVFPYSEFCTVTRGRITITDSAGNKTTFRPGDSFFIAQGEPATLEVHEAIQVTFFLHIGED